MRYPLEFNEQTSHAGSHVVRAVSQWLPLTNAVALVRPLFMDQWPTDWLRPLAVLVVFAVGGLWIALALTRKRFQG